MQKQKNRAPSLALAIYGFVLCLFLVGSLTMAGLIYSRSKALIAQSLDSAVRLRTNTAALTLARAIHSDWQDLLYLRGQISSRNPAQLQSLLDGVVGDRSNVTWAGFAGTDGTVQAASGGQLVGQSVTERPWFRNGLQGNFAGDVHDAKLLQKLVGSATGEPMRFIDLATPVKDANGDVIGVLAMHINFAWAAHYLTETARMLGINAYLVGQDGKVVLATGMEDPNETALQSFQQAHAGLSGAQRERWSDGHVYFTDVLPAVSYRDLPNFGWRMIGRLDSDTFSPDLIGLGRAVGADLLVLIVLLALMTVVFVRVFIWPLSALSGRAERIADGSDEYPGEAPRTQEGMRLSAALTRLQAQRGGETFRERRGRK